jgi:hypothetical protein
MTLGAMAYLLLISVSVCLVAMMSFLLLLGLSLFFLVLIAFSQIKDSLWMLLHFLKTYFMQGGQTFLEVREHYIISKSVNEGS